jgi:hypothetical protein
MAQYNNKLIISLLLPCARMVTDVAIVNAHIDPSKRLDMSVVTEKDGDVKPDAVKIMYRLLSLIDESVDKLQSTHFNCKKEMWYKYYPQTLVFILDKLARTKYYVSELYSKQPEPGEVPNKKAYIARLINCVLHVIYGEMTWCHCSDTSHIGGCDADSRYYNNNQGVSQTIWDAFRSGKYDVPTIMF